MERSSNHAPQRGFTLIEVMITVVIVAILASIALPAYQNQVTRGNRAAAKGEMLDLANREQQLLLADRAYGDTTAIAATGYTLPADVANNYSYAVTVAGGPPPSFLITFTAIGRQAGDGNLTLDSEGTKLPADKWAR